MKIKKDFILRLFISTMVLSAGLLVLDGCVATTSYNSSNPYLRPIVVQGKYNELFSLARKSAFNVFPDGQISSDSENGTIRIVRYNFLRGDTLINITFMKEEGDSFSVHASSRGFGSNPPIIDWSTGEVKRFMKAYTAAYQRYKKNYALEPTTEKPPKQTQKITKSSGTGFAVSDNGLIVTACHIIQEAKTIRVYLVKELSFSATIIHSDPINDLALLKIEKSTPNFLRIAPMRSVKMGDKVFTIGFPMSQFLGQEAKYSEGVVSALSGLQDAPSFLQITVPIQPGNSGGPLVNEKGEVVGIITSTAAILPFIKESGTLPQNINWAVKGDYLRPLIELPEAEPVELNREQLIEHVKEATFFIEADIAQID